MKSLLSAVILVLGFASAAQAAVGSWRGEENYLRCNDDVRRAVYNGSIRSGYEHYINSGRYELRIVDGSCYAEDAPRWFDEAGYLRCNPDVARAVWRRDYKSGWAHYRLHGEGEGRKPTCDHF